MKYAPLFVLLFASVAQADCVVLLHGLARSSGSMEPLAEELRAAGYRVVNIDYPSRHYPIDELADVTVTSALDQCNGAREVHFVTHSLGGILVRQYQASQPIERLGRVVMLGPPNHGSEVVDELGNVPGFQLLNGQAGLQLGTGESSVPSRLGPADFELGIIAGTESINLLLSTIIPGEDDGKVSVESARLEGMSDFITVPVSHPFLMQDRVVMHQVLHYLEHGSFERSPEN